MLPSEKPRPWRAVLAPVALAALLSASGGVGACKKN